MASSGERGVQQTSSRAFPPMWLGAVPLLLCFQSDATALAGEAAPVVSRTLKTAEDRQLSPFTGYTRQHWLEITEKLLAGVLPYYNAEMGLFDLKGVPSETAHFQKLSDDKGHFQRESLDRIMMLATVYVCATGKDNVSGYDGSITAPFRDAIIKGTDPQSPRYWGPRTPNNSQGSVIAMGVLLAPKWFWDPLTPEQQKNLLASFKNLAFNSSYDNNHYFFHMVPVSLLEKNGIESNREHLTDRFQRLLNWHRGSGWFADGGNRGFDHYNLWGFQCYAQAVCYFDKDWRKQFGPQVNAITGEFLKSMPYLYGRDGGPIPWGRSLVYRFADDAAIGWAVLNGACTLPPGQARRIASGCLKYFWDQGCMSENGLLEAGFRSANSIVAEPYVDHGTAYFAAQGLACLLIPADDPFWTKPEEPMPADGAGGTLALPAAEMVLRVRASDGDARMYPVGQPFSHWGNWQRGVKYCQHAYASNLGWCALGEGSPDIGAGRTGVSVDGTQWSYRERPRPIRVDANHLVSTYDLEAALGGKEFGELITHTLIGKNGEVHIFWHNCAKPLYLHIGGYGISVPHGQELKQTPAKDRLLISGGENHSVIEVLRAPAGELRVDILEPRQGFGHSHLFGGKGAFPYWRSSAPVPPNVPIVVYVDGSRGQAPAVPQISVQMEKGEPSVELDGTHFALRFPY